MKKKHTLKSCAISRTRRWKGNLRMRSSVDFWYRRISRSATVPGRKRWGFLTPPVAVYNNNSTTLVQLEGEVRKAKRGVRRQKSYERRTWRRAAYGGLCLYTT